MTRASPTVIHVFGARPNVVKVAPVHAALAARGVAQVLLHTGQHSAREMRDVFFEELGLPEPEVRVEGRPAGATGWQVASMLPPIEEALRAQRPQTVVVYGDVDSTLAGALVANHLGIPVAHVEAGLRSHDRSMPEEVNRVLVDQLSSLLFTPSPDAGANLAAEGIPHAGVHFVGNVMIDSLVRLLPRARERAVLGDLGLQPGSYGLVTLHRPSNVDDEEILRGLVGALSAYAERQTMVFPVHPRTARRLEAMSLRPGPGVVATPPLGYLDFLALLASARLVVTDSGGVQEESTYLGIPCLTVRTSTERPVTVTRGTNRLVEPSPARLLAALEETAASPPPVPEAPPELWDGRAAERIAEVLCR